MCMRRYMQHTGAHTCHPLASRPSGSHMRDTHSHKHGLCTRHAWTPASLTRHVCILCVVDTPAERSGHGTHVPYSMARVVGLTCSDIPSAHGPVTHMHVTCNRHGAHVHVTRAVTNTSAHPAHASHTGTASLCCVHVCVRTRVSTRGLCMHTHSPPQPSTAYAYVASSRVYVKVTCP